MRNRVQYGVLVVLAVLPLLIAEVSGAEPMTRDEVPEPLQTWIEWVLHGNEQRACPFFNSGSTTFNAICAWPSRLELELDDKGG